MRGNLPILDHTNPDVHLGEKVKNHKFHLQLKLDLHYYFALIRYK